MISYSKVSQKERADIDARPFVVQTHFSIGDIVRHRLFDFRGVIFDVDPVFSNSEEWYQSIPEQVRPDRNQPFYHLLAEGEEGSYTAYVSQGNLVPDADAGPVYHPQVAGLFEQFADGRYTLKSVHKH